VRFTKRFDGSVERASVSMMLNRITVSSKVIFQVA
jgi:hypothetical protein